MILVSDSMDERGAVMGAVAVVGLLDEATNVRVKNWSGSLPQRLRAKSQRTPHVTLLVAGRVEGDVKSKIEQVATDIGPLPIYGSSLCVVRSPRTGNVSIGICIARGTVLDDLYMLIRSECSGNLVSLSPYTEYETWVPHVSIYRGEISNASLGIAVRGLLKENQMEVRGAIVGLALMHEVSAQLELLYSVRLRE